MVTWILGIASLAFSVPSSEFAARGKRICRATLVAAFSNYIVLRQSPNAAV